MTVSMILCLHCDGVRTDPYEGASRCGSRKDELQVLPPNADDNLFRRLEALKASAAAAGWSEHKRADPLNLLPSQRIWLCPVCSLSGGSRPQG